MTIKNRFPDVAPVLNLDFANTKRLDPRITFTRASTGTYVDEFGIIRTAAANQARFDHDSAGNSLGLLIEESRTNSLTYSAEFDNAAWTKTRTTITANAAVAPDGTTTADKLIRNTDNNINVVYQTVSLSQTTYTLSTFAKKGEYSFCTLNLPATQGWDADRWVSVDLTDGSYAVSSSAPTSTSVEEYPNGWYRISITHAASATVTRSGYIEARSTSGYGSQAGDGTSGIYIWGAQLEAGSFPTSYIPTSGSTATRSADVASMTGTNFSSWYNPGTGTLASQTRLLAGSRSSITYVFATRPAGSTGINVYYPNEYTLTGALKDVGASYSSAPGAGFNKGAFAMDPSGSAGYINGAAGSQGSITVQTTPCSEARIGAGGVPNSTMSGHISRLTYYDRRLTDAQLQALTL